MAEAGMPYVKVVLMVSDGTSPERAMGLPVTLQVPKLMSLKVAKMYATEAISQALKGDAIEAALKAVGCK